MTKPEKCTCNDKCLYCSQQYKEMLEKVEQLDEENKILKEQLKDCEKNLENAKARAEENFAIDQIKDSDHLVKLHTGLYNLMTIFNGY